ncbi:MAG: O-antigen ligase family protein [Anaerolineales bacterium]|nr:MAG: O-antigen ligase family protein [Anaerolineales bacterium]
MIKKSALLDVRKASNEIPFSTSRFIIFALFNILLAYLSKQSSFFSTFYGLSILMLGIFFLVADRTPIRVIYICGYVVGAELIWRSTGASIFYEFAKYAIVFLLSLSLLRFDLLKQAIKWPILYFLLLMPSVFLMPFFDRESIASWLSGPLLLAVSTVFFSSVSLTNIQTKKLLIMIIAPTIGVASLAIVSILSASNLEFTTQTNFTTAGGSLPVQVSLQLAFGAVLASYYLITEKRTRLMVPLMLLIAIWLISQSIFTFSRSGLYTAGVTLLAFFLVHLKQNRQRIRLILFGAVLVLIMGYIIFPYMDDFTDGVLLARYMEIDSTGRDALANIDIQVFINHPWFGVGLGQSVIYHIGAGHLGTAHTEYTRMLAEHGIFGLFSLLIMLGLAGKQIFIKTSPDTRSFNILMIVWALVYMTSIALRTAAPGFAFGLGSLVISSDNVVDNEAKKIPVLHLLSNVF